MLACVLKMVQYSVKAQGTFVVVFVVALGFYALSLGGTGLREVFEAEAYFH